MSTTTNKTASLSDRIMNGGAITESILIGRFFKNRKHDIVAVKIKSYEGTVFVDIRQHYQNAAGVTCPTRKGIGIRLQRLPELVDLLEKALEKARALKLIPEAGA